MSLEISGDVSFNLLVNKGPRKTTTLFSEEELYRANDLEHPTIFIKINYTSSDELVLKSEDIDSNREEQSEELNNSEDLELRANIGLNYVSSTLPNYNTMNYTVNGQKLETNLSIPTESEEKILERDVKNRFLDIFKPKLQKHAISIVSNPVKHKSEEHVTKNFTTSIKKMTSKREFRKHSRKNKNHKLKSSAKKDDNKTTNNKHEKRRERSMVTLGTTDECVYQYPKKEQLHTLLSDMTNQLTKLCLPAIRKTRKKYDTKRKHFRRMRQKKKRFHVVKNLGASNFDRVFVNMTENLKKAYNKTLQNLEVGNPCTHQKKLKLVWKKLLKRSKNELHRAAMECHQSYLHARTQAEDSRAVVRLQRTLAQELASAHHRHLESLCDKFQLCFHELVE